MASLSSDIENRVRKLPKPSNVSQAMQPLFEAVSNAMFAVDDRRVEDPSIGRGKILVTVENLGDADKLQITVSDNGIGLDKVRYAAFEKVDTDFKFAKGGKGVGRLFWLDAFRETYVGSKYRDGISLNERSFAFLLKKTEQIEIGHGDQAMALQTSIGTTVVFKGLTERYSKYFPKRTETFLQYFSSHFIADFLMNQGPQIDVVIDSAQTHYPDSVAKLVHGQSVVGQTEEHPDFGILRIAGYFCDPKASSGLDGNHQLHLLADGRSVEARKIDKLLGVQKIEQDGDSDLIFHGCVSGDYLDVHVNEGRTAFVLKEEVLKNVCRYVSDFIKDNFIRDQIENYKEDRRADYRVFVTRYPIYGFDDEEVQLDRVPFGARGPEEFATGLVKYQIRREEDRQDQLVDVIKKLDDNQVISSEFSDRVVEAAKEIQQSELLALAQHVSRRKLVLELLEKLIKRIRDRGEKEQDFHLESTLHSLIVPMRVAGVDPSTVESSSHDLWIVDERLSYTRYFASDKRLNEIIAESKLTDRPDLLVWNMRHSLGLVDASVELAQVDVTKPLNKVLLVEFKRPGRTAYNKVEDQIEQQVKKYVRELKEGEIESFSKHKIRIANDCQFHCYVIADIDGDLEQQLDGWSTVANGQGRVRHLDGSFKGTTIEVIQWIDLVNDAWARNESTLGAAGLRRRIAR
jgi:hypothetical protein